MSGIVTTEMGSITVRSDVIATYAGSIAVETFGIVGMAAVSVKDGLVKLLKRDSYKRGINVTINNNKITLGFHVIVAYGVNISAVVENLRESVSSKVASYTGMEVERIDVFVEGIRVID